jgi:biopolymer transport protein ExbB/biopolymer transport protein TolQ
VLIEKLLKVALLGSSWVLYLLLALSVFSIATMFERWLFFRRRDDDVDELGERLIALLGHGDVIGADALLKKSPAIEARVLESGLRYVESGPDAVADAMEGRMIRERRDIERGSTLLGTLGNNAPFIGLFGTVIGVIIAFHQLGASQSSASMANVMGGIAEALVATGVGLFVAIPAVVAYNIIQKTITEIEDNVASIGKELTALLKGGQGRLAGAGSRGDAPASPHQSDSGLRDLAPTGTN